MNILNNPYPLEQDFKKNIKLSLIVGFFVFFFLYVFQPAKTIYSIESLNIISAIKYSFITFLTMLFFYHGLLLLFPKTFNEDKWTVLKGIIHNFTLIFFISFFNFLLFIINSNIQEYNSLFFINGFIQLLMITFLVGFFPTIGLIFYNQNVLLKQYLLETETINDFFKHKKTINEITIKGKGKNEILEIEIKNLIYIKSIGNYCEIYLEDNNKAILFRNSLADVKNQVKTHKIYKCHRSYLVNLEKVIKISGDAQGLKLHFEGLDNIVPVSRNLTKEIKELLMNRNF